MSAAEAENIPTNVSSGDAETAVTAPSKGAKAKKTKEVKPKKKPAAEKKAAPKKKASSPPSHPKYEEVQIRFQSKAFYRFQIRNF